MHTFSSRLVARRFLYRAGGRSKNPGGEGANSNVVQGIMGKSRNRVN